MRERRWAVAVFWTLLLSARAVFADDVVVDPELQGVKANEPAKPSDVVVTDPELAGSTPAKKIDTSVAPAASDTIWRASIHSRWGVDTHGSMSTEDIVEGTTVASLDAVERRSDALMFSVGMRARHSYAHARGGGDRSELVFEPTSAFVDVTPADGYHFRAGYQNIAMGRFDVFSATNFLAVYDLESGPVTMPEASIIAQPALRFDFDRVQGFALQAYYVPFFQPDRVALYGSDYALLSPSVLSYLTPATSGGAAPRSSSEFNRSQIANASTGVLSALGPAPDLSHPQGALRATLHGSAGELSGTVGTALEKLPALGPDPNTLVDYGRYEVATLDGAIGVGPIQFGAEAAYMANRTLGAIRVSTPPVTSPDQPRTEAASAKTNVVQGALRAELVDASGWAAEVEGFVLETLSAAPNLPPTLGSTATRYEWFTLQDGRYWSGVAGGVHYAPDGARFRLELGGVWFTGPTYAVLPRVEWEVVPTVFFELGGAFVGGPRPQTPLGSSLVSLGGLFTDVDQVYAGVRWTP